MPSFSNSPFIPLHISSGKSSRTCGPVLSLLQACAHVRAPSTTGRFLQRKKLSFSTRPTHKGSSVRLAVITNGKKVHQKRRLCGDPNNQGLGSAVLGGGSARGFLRVRVGVLGAGAVRTGEEGAAAGRKEAQGTDCTRSPFSALCLPQRRGKVLPGPDGTAMHP